MNISDHAGTTRQFEASAEAFGRRFSWSGQVRIVNDPPTYILSAADWLTLVEKFGLAANLDDAARTG